MDNEKKMSPDMRQRYIINTIKNAHQPVTGSELAKQTNVSRQVIVQDISILKAKNEPIIATSQGYMYIKQQPTTIQQIVAVHHSPERTKEELYLLVDHGVTVKDVIVEHPVYGDLTASIMVSNRLEVDRFIQHITETKSTYLSMLTNGTHLHTIEADSMEKLNLAKEALQKANFLLES